MTSQSATSTEKNKNKNKSNPSFTQDIISGGKFHGDVTLENITQISSQTVINRKVDFFEPDLTQYQSSNFKSPFVSEQLLDVLKRYNFLVLGDGIDVDKSSLARHLASLMVESNTQIDFVVKEWYRNADSGDIDFELEETKECKILILTHVTQQNLIGYSFLDIQKIAARLGHFVIATTDLPFAAWLLADTCKAWWRDLHSKHVQDCPDLINKLSHEESLNDWYYKQLNAREQLLAIGLSLFDGLFDDQFFAALEAVVGKAWKNRDANLKALDYYDLANLRGYFEFLDTEDNRTLVKIRFPKQRFTCLKIAWKSYRRQILAVLPVLVDLVKGTKQYVVGELYGSEIRREKLRQSVSEAISAIGLISRLGSREAVEENLLTLAASPDIEVQAVAAQSVASWRDQENKGFILANQSRFNIENELFELLKSWRTKTEISRFISFLLGDKAQQGSNQPSDYIRATLAITTAYASLYDEPNKVSKDLFDLFKDLSADKNNMVRDRFEKYTAPIFIGRHLSSVREFLLEMIEKVDLIPVIVDSLASSYRFNSNQILSLINEWKESCKTNYTSVAKDNKVGRREALLITIVRTYSQIFNLNEPEKILGLNTDRAFEEVLEVLKYERHPLVREVALLSIGDLLKIDPSLLSTKVKLLVPYLSQTKGIEKLIGFLSEIYLDQRSSLQTGEDVVEIDDRKYPVWLKGDKPVTELEKVLMVWLKDDESRDLQEIAARSFMEYIKNFEDKERKAIKKIEAKSTSDKSSESSSELKVSSEPYIQFRTEPGTFLANFIPRLATQGNREYRPGVSHLLPPSAKQRLLNNSGVEFFLGKLKSSSDNHLTSLSNFLERGLWLARYFWLLSGTAAVVGLFLLFWIGNQTNRTSERFDSSYSTEETNPNNSSGSSSQPVTPEVNPFAQKNYPQLSCGDPLPNDSTLYPIQFHPVFISYSDEALINVRSSACQDALRVRRQGTGAISIQVASFLNRRDAELFRDFIGEYFGGAEVGEPTQIDSKP